MRSAPRALACHVRVFRFRAPASPAQRILGGGFGRGAKPPSEWNVQRVRLACGRRAPPCSWTLLIALANRPPERPLTTRSPLRERSGPVGRETSAGSHFLGVRLPFFDRCGPGEPRRGPRPLCLFGPLPQAVALAQD